MTTRALGEKAFRLSMLGSGRKAAITKWLDTEDLYACSLEGMCRDQGLPDHCSKAELVRRLKYADKAVVDDDRALYLASTTSAILYLFLL
jgi:hypothetical protein